MKHIFNKAKSAIIKKKQPLMTSALLACVLVSYQNCQQKEQYFAKASMSPFSEPPLEAHIQSPTHDPDQVSLCHNGSSDDLICNPLGSGGQTTTEPPAVAVSRLGLIASLYEGQDQWNNIDRYFTEGYKHPENIYFSNFNIPTRAFSDGFSYGDNDFLKNRTGDKLIEWFAIKAKGHITLPESEAGGKYHLVTISDDGIQVTVNGQRILSNPNTHAPRIDCATEFIELKKGEEKSFELSYFQGPRYHIALMTFIKKIDDPAAYVRSGLCNTGNGPEALLSEGYKVIGQSWFTLPEGY